MINVVNSRIYFSRYFYSIFRKSNTYRFFTRSGFDNSEIFFYSDPYYHARSSKSLALVSYDLLSFNFTRSAFNKYFFPLGFFQSNDGLQQFYSFYWKVYENNDKIFKNLIVVFLKLHFSTISFNMSLKVFISVLAKKINSLWLLFHNCQKIFVSKKSVKLNLHVCKILPKNAVLVPKFTQ